VGAWGRRPTTVPAPNVIQVDERKSHHRPDLPQRLLYQSSIAEESGSKAAHAPISPAIVKVAMRVPSGCNSAPSMVTAGRSAALPGRTAVLLLSIRGDDEDALGLSLGRQALRSPGQDHGPGDGRRMSARTSVVGVDDDRW
jgi:hypothetical protein